ncbi:UbiA family prenyltransferase [Aeoliella sp. ICT_H6.2]|uniref:UbiA family prenyltransferase n=1 Tax=Aeoliella straminimaris TaxID=2954799 RepID=A0A9X2JHU8_9BACT|nr:UbiA family prenyltransferase [Aeoliella straminimaris]MCO6046420.1 UbiA family prenyltransferase [Aeoliella straminimaris]
MLPSRRRIASDFSNPSFSYPEPTITARQLIQVARPGLWSTQLWFYLLPLGGHRLLDTVGFWLGAVYVMFPLGLLLYGWNDWADYETDRLNPRKGNLLFGARLPAEALKRLPWMIAVVQIPFFVAFTLLIGAKFLLWIAAAVAVNACYNSPAINFKGRPLLDALSQSGYLLVFVLASWVNNVPQLPWPVFLFGLLFAIHSHLLAEITDIEPDRAAGRRTTAVAIGGGRTKLVVALILLAESTLLFAYFSQTAMGRLAAGFLLLAGVGFAGDGWLRGGRTIAPRHLAYVLVAWNVVAVASMYLVWRNGLFVR